MCCYKHLAKIDRIRIEKLLIAKKSVAEIARIIRVSRMTIYREIERGKYLHTNPLTHKDEYRYSSDLAEEVYQNNLRAKGVAIKLSNDYQFANYIEKKIADEKYSPKAVLEEIKRDNIPFKTSICFKTLYNYIDKGVFLRITNKDLPVKKDKRRRYRIINTVRLNKPGESIEKRPSYINERSDFGHWEMDTVIGKKSSKYCLLVLTERMTRKELIRKIPGKKADNVVEELNKLELLLGKRFTKIFKTITVDNGCEFMYCDEMEKSIINPEEKRVKIYYCHPYTSWERGSNEVANRLIRRFLPKSYDFDDVPEEQINYIESWINNYPREIFGYGTSEHKYREAIAGFT